MMPYGNRLLAESTLYEIETTHEMPPGHITLATMARCPETVAAVNRARERIAIDRWRELNRAAVHVHLTDEERAAATETWLTLPGYTCIMDAISIIARPGGPGTRRDRHGLGMHRSDPGA